MVMFHKTKEGNRMEIDEIRIPQAELQGLPLCGERWTFYYDETGNCRKLVLKDSGVNAPSALREDFVLGGVLLGEGQEPDIENFFESLDLKNKNKMPEVKFLHLVQKETDLLTILERPNVQRMLDWLIDNKVDIHYATLNNLYYILADIVDSAIYIFPELLSKPSLIFTMKDGLYRFAAEKQEELLTLLYRYEYPNIAREQMPLFAEELSDMMRDSSLSEDFYLETLRQLLATAGKRRELPFLEDEESYMLIESYVSLYLSRCSAFKYARHIFDNEPYVEKRLRAMELTDNGRAFQNYEFLDSKSSRYIQLSDMVVGLLGKTFQWLDAMPEHAIRSVRRVLNEKQLSAICKINVLVDRSDRRNPMLIQNVNSPMNVRSRGIKLTLLAK